jgi:hypothetical protein
MRRKNHISKFEIFKKYITQNYRWLVILSILFFVLYKFWLISTVWSGRNVAPEPDDSYTYIGLINLVYQGQLFGHLSGIPVFTQAHLMYSSYTFLAAFLAKILYLSPEGIYQLIFYLGTILLSLTLAYFLKVFTKNNLLLAFVLIIMAMYNGSGNYHGFFWVVPSFFARLLFFVLLAQLISSSKYWIVFTIFGSLLFILAHPISLYATTIFIFWVFFYSFLERRVNYKTILRTLFTVIVSLIWSFLSELYFISRGMVIDGEYSIRGIVSAIQGYLTYITSYIQNIFGSSINSVPVHLVSKNIPVAPIQVDNWKVIQSEYFNILFFHPILLFGFLLLIFILFKRKQNWILALYFSCIVFVLLSTITWFGYRSLDYLWTVTFMVIGLGFYYLSIDLFKFRDILLGKILSASSAMAVICFIIVLSVFNYIWARNLNLRENLTFNRACINFLLDNTKVDERISYGGKTAYAIFTSFGLFERGVNFNLKDIKNGEYLVMQISKPSTFYNPKNNLIRFLTSNISRKDVINTQNDREEMQTSRYLLIKNCGDFNIYQTNGNKDG